MTVQTIEIAGQRFVIIPEPDFRELERRLLANGSTSQFKTSFEPVTPFEVSGESASEMLIRERR